ncbi:Domain of unknown function (DUF3472) [Rheinheimera sp. A13L]|uniref:DUF3472 domain-containing protein n=1 Tax=Rheinheimera sp. A13L TaxID=506534 RepID=UPI000212490A|nr:DUF3472 domain-containing protein [Rheinheimera sp. A13L]EGM76610.1 Domain of unknown function (DUF3472) [Rheinheimera sp. A13L]
MMRYLMALLGLSFLTACGGSSAEQTAVTATPVQQQPLPYQLSLAANSWVEGDAQATGAIVTDQGITNWQHADDVLAVYLYLPQTGELDLALTGQVAQGESKLEVSVNEQRQTVTLTGASSKQHAVGRFQVTQTGYQKILLRGVSSSGQTFAELTQLNFGGSAAANASYIKDEVYWGRRGPSVHLTYQLPENSTTRWFYSEMEIPSGSDTLGSYFMANGFADGYFGIQVNSATERRVLFSVWSPYETDDPSSIPEEFQVKLLRKGAQVQTGEFGNEGSGGQSFLRYLWQTDTRYRFLLKAEPQNDNHTHYSAWFYPPESGQWQLIASFSRPDTQRNIERPHSFLENFIPETGDTGRKVYFPSQWFADAAGNWTQNRSASFTVDGTGGSGNRLDFKGGVTEQGFMLQNCGFFSDTTAVGTSWQLPVSNAVPQIDFAALP